VTLQGEPELVDPDFNALPPDPLIKLRLCLEAAHKLGISEPMGLLLSTVDGQGRPWSRVVLMKDCDTTGVVFGTSEDSSKGRDFKANSCASGTLWWRETVQQIHLQGRVTCLSDAQSDELFQSRTRDAQAIAVLSHQRIPFTSADEYDLKVKVLELVNSKKIIMRPSQWHAYHLKAEAMEFWYGSKDRFHKRVRYDIGDGVWTHQRLQP